MKLPAWLHAVLSRRIIETAPERDSRMLALEGAFGAFLINLISPFVSMFAKNLGAGDFQLGLLSGLPQLVGVLAMVPGALYLGSRRDQRRMVMLLALGMGIIYPLAALTPYAAPAWRVWAYVAVISLVNWPASLYNVAMQSFVAEVFPGPMCAPAYARRSRYQQIGSNLAILVGGVGLEYLPMAVSGDPAQQGAIRQMMYQAFFASALVWSICQVIMLSRMRTYQPAGQSRRAGWEELRQTLKVLFTSKAFIGYLTVVLLFHISWHMGWTQFFIYQVDYRDCTEIWLASFTISFGMGSLLSYAWWSRRMQRHSSIMILVVGMAGLAFNPVGMMIAPTRLGMVVCQFIVGLTNGAFVLPLYDGMIRVLPGEIQNRSLAIAVYQTVLAISNAIFPVVGVWIYRGLGAWMPGATAIVLSLSMTAFLRALAALNCWRYARRQKHLEGKE
nr:hypothetical protein [bacterium]